MTKQSARKFLVQERKRFAVVPGSLNGVEALYDNHARCSDRLAPGGQEFRVDPVVAFLHLLFRRGDRGESSASAQDERENQQREEFCSHGMALQDQRGTVKRRFYADASMEINETGDRRQLNQTSVSGSSPRIDCHVGFRLPDSPLSGATIRRFRRLPSGDPESPARCRTGQRR